MVVMIRLKLLWPKQLGKRIVIYAISMEINIYKRY